MIPSNLLPIVLDPFIALVNKSDFFSPFESALHHIAICRGSTATNSIDEISSSLSSYVISYQISEHCPISCVVVHESVLMSLNAQPNSKVDVAPHLTSAAPRPLDSFSIQVLCVDAVHLPDQQREIANSLKKQLNRALMAGGMAAPKDACSVVLNSGMILQVTTDCHVQLQFDISCTPLTISSWEMIDALSFEFPNRPPLHPPSDFLSCWQNSLLSGGVSGRVLDWQYGKLAISDAAVEQLRIHVDPIFIAPQSSPVSLISGGFGWYLFTLGSYRVCLSGSSGMGKTTILERLRWEMQSWLGIWACMFFWWDNFLFVDAELVECATMTLTKGYSDLIAILDRFCGEERPSLLLLDDFDVMLSLEPSNVCGCMGFRCAGASHF